jgi:hypothetical protein
MSKWTLEEAVEVCRMVEQTVPPFGCHVALTGGCLYKDGARKDLDLLFYRIRQTTEISLDAMWDALAAECGIKKLSGFGWCFKAELNGKPIDCLFPEEPDGEYATQFDEVMLDEIPFDIGEAA